MVKKGSSNPTAVLSVLGTLTVVALIVVIGLPIVSYLGYVMLALSSAGYSKSPTGNGVAFFQRAAEIALAAAAPTVAAILLLPSRSPVRRYLDEHYGSRGAGGDGKATGQGSHEDKLVLYRRYFPNLFSHFLDRLPDRIPPGEYDRDLFRIQIYTNGATTEANGPDDAQAVESLKKEVQEYAVAEVRKRLETN
jgi:hypothetical protein